MKTPPPPAEPDLRDAVLGIVASLLIVVLNNADTIDQNVDRESGRTIWDVFRRAINEVEVNDRNHLDGLHSVTLRGDGCDYRIIVRKVAHDG